MPVGLARPDYECLFSLFIRTGSGSFFQFMDRNDQAASCHSYR